MAGIAQRELRPVLDNLCLLLAIIPPDGGIVDVFSAGVIHGETKARYRKLALSSPFPSARVIATGERSVLSDLNEHLAEYPLLEIDWQANGFEASATVPLRGGSGLLGSLALIWSHSVRFDSYLRAELGALGDIMGAALATMIRKEAEDKLARVLHRSVLRLDQLPANAAIAARYHSSRDSFGGNWYDAIALDHGRVGLIVGGVVGSGLRATTALSQLRSAAAAAALVDPSPAKVMEALDHLADRSLGRAGYAKAVFGVLDVTHSVLDYSIAGHVPPVVVTPDGEVQILNEGRRWVLGLERPRSIKAARCHFPPGSLLVMFTDGLTERNGESLELSLSRLARKLERIWWMPTSLICDQLFEEFDRESGDTDDVALLAVRAEGAHNRAYADVIAGVVENVPLARHRLDLWLVDQGVEEPDRDDFLLAMSEAIGNAVLHGNHNDPKHLVTIEAGLDRDTIVGSVRDRGGWPNEWNAAEKPRGLGFRLMRGLADAVELKSTSDLTRVVIRRDRKVRRDVFEAAL
ncbi:MAG: ATP-binding SpoIIE family protein phosphatase [Acidimicrobiia bacterium]